ncbi:DNA-binding IclR family transcriptional regulator [Arthrobacter sp. 1088]|uniref:IclR family transcriptional regulator n=1 Tax=Arthrobacter sp. 1088 TaxID=2817768 RepID=UPI002861E2BE|nr:helix-turn-helix domain-containing protein [Arthrobacter sp. 1088]MDR6688926.1 DNA-binding IclR family transcriptional regulator [Arthrobacter sp. 1088]
MARDIALQTVVKTIRVLEALVQINERAVGPSRLAQELGWTRAAAHQYMASLAEAGWLQQDSDRKYLLTGNASLFGRFTIERAGAPTQLLSAMPALVDRLNEAVSFAVLNGEEAVIIERYEPRRSFAVQPDAERHMKVTESASGRVLIAFDSRAPENLIRAIADQLEPIRSKGFAYHRGEWMDDIVEAVAVPIMRGTECLGALSAVAPDGRMDVDDAAKTLLEARKDIEAALNKD